MCNSRVFSADCTTTYSLPLSVECRQFAICTSFPLPVDHFRTMCGATLHHLLLLAVSHISLKRYAAISEYLFLLRKARR